MSETSQVEKTVHIMDIVDWEIFAELFFFRIRNVRALNFRRVANIKRAHNNFSRV